ncbi:MAG: hypothetical protein K9N48_06970 [Verrucomicrobia bacterium]|nr:hypothetical protein [Verrucomicrobiota bacterium]MCF7707558.1 hypothetical protein [Verrucomicrobiota bacterium]
MTTKFWINVLIGLLLLNVVFAVALLAQNTRLTNKLPRLQQQRVNIGKNMSVFNNLVAECRQYARTNPEMNSVLNTVFKNTNSTQPSVRMIPANNE